MVEYKGLAECQASLPSIFNPKMDCKCECHNDDINCYKICRNFSESGNCSKTEFTGTHITGDFAEIHTKVSWEMECSIDGRKPGRITIRKEINGQTVWLDVSKCLGSQCQQHPDCQKIRDWPDSQQRPEWNANNKVVQI